MGRPRHPFKDLYFEQLSEIFLSTKRYAEKCKYCSHVIDEKGELLEKHITVTCLEITPELRAQALGFLTDRSAFSLEGLAKKAQKRSSSQSPLDTTAATIDLEGSTGRGKAGGKGVAH